MSMKTMIFVCSNSGIDYIPHAGNICSIPVILRLTEEEQYEDFSDVTTEAFYNRIRLDKKARVTPVFQNYAKICAYIDRCREEGYSQVLFILASKEFSDLYIPITIAISENTDICCYVYNSDTCCYPLAYMAIEAGTLFEKGCPIEVVMKELDSIKKNHHIFFFNPSYTKETEKSFSRYYTQGTAVSLENGVLCPLKEKGVSGLDGILNQFQRETADCNVIPFILYTNKGTKYIPLLEEALGKMDLSFKKVKSYPIPPAVGIQASINAVGLGYIVK